MSNLNVGGSPARCCAGHCITCSGIAHWRRRLSKLEGLHSMTELKLIGLTQKVFGALLRRKTLCRSHRRLHQASRRSLLDLPRHTLHDARDAAATTCVHWAAAHMPVTVRLPRDVSAPSSASAAAASRAGDP